MTKTSLAIEEANKRKQTSRRKERAQISKPQTSSKSRKHTGKGKRKVVEQSESERSDSGALKVIWMPRRHDSGKEIVGQPGAPLPSPVYGSARYDFQPYDEPIQDPALRKAHEHIHLLQRFIKWQERSLRKVVKQVKSLKMDMKSLKSKFSTMGCSYLQSEEVVDSVAEQATGIDAHMEEDIAEKHLFQGVSSSYMGTQEPPRASSYERRQRRKRRAIRSPTPPLPTSSNSSYSFSSTSWQ